MKKLIILAVLVLGLSFFGISQVQAGETDSISVTVSLTSEISVSLDKTTWNIGSTTLNSTTSPETFVATVGNSSTKLELMGADGANGWKIDTPAGVDKFEVAVADPAIKLTTAYQELAANVDAYGDKSFDLTYTAPSSDSKGAGKPQGFSIMVKASATP